jgi:hypothetical protein
MKISLKNFKDTLTRNEMKQVSGGKAIDEYKRCGSCTKNSDCDGPNGGGVCWGSYPSCPGKVNICY